ncbi:8-oxo-dGTP diphosphatase [Candidatus Thermoflexus japonica]|uniref:8-oxo-dGTP diphosphatase n=1 Tax=Candidatus Thermoflexus japonica TaxID=2035417 RepID=A0A2H5Y6B0_9CHLR|nr:8-oxo-dGTP diphosphatase [Candidatus Thermoflexus japonica]
MGRADQGNVAGRWAVIPRVLCFLFRGDQVLLLQRSPERKIFPGRYNGLGGHVEPGEDLRTAARRELAEEAGIPVEALRLAGLITVDTGTSPGVLVAVFVGETSGEPTRSTPEGTLVWMPISQVLELPVVEDFPVLWPRVLRFRETGELFFLSYAYDAQDHLIFQEG